MTRLKWLWYKFWAWITKPWQPKGNTPNPRDKKKRTENPFYRPALYFMYALNILTLYLIIMLLALEMVPAP